MPQTTQPAQSRFASPTITEVLRSIQECTTDLVSIHDRKLVLQSIVHRTRTLLGADMSYVSLNDLSAGETYIYLTEGVRTDAYRQIRMPLGAGVLGSAAAGSSIATANDYLGDTDMVHVPAIDRIVEEEGVRTVVAAPLRIGGRVAGALLIANRVRSQLLPRGRFALEQLAVQASVVIDQVRRGEEVVQLRMQIGERDANSALKLRDINQMLQLDDRLMRGTVQAADPGGVLEILAQVFHHPVGLYSPEGQLMHGEAVLPTDVNRDEERQIRATAHVSFNAGRPALMLLGEDSYVVMGVAAAGEPLAFAVVAGMDRSEWPVLERSANFLSTGLLVERMLTEVDYHAQSTLIEDVVSVRGGHPSANLIQQLADHRIGRGSSVTGLCVWIPTAQRQLALGAVRSALSTTRAIVSPHAGHICALVGQGTGRELAMGVAAALRSAGAPAAVGYATTQGPIPQSLPDVHSLSVDVARAADALGLTDGAHDAISLGVGGLLLCGTDPSVAEGIISRFLGRLLDYDRRHSTELVDTAWQYFEHQGRLEPTASALNVHANTVKQRLARIGAVQGSDWRHGPHAIDLHFALRLWKVRTAIETAPARSPGR